MKDRRPIPNGGWPEGRKGKGKGMAVHFSRLESGEMDPESEEIPAGEVNFSSRFINLANVLGAGDRERKNWAKECSSIIDPGFNG